MTEMEIAKNTGECPVNTWNEWDPLEEVIVGTAWGAHKPSARDPIEDAGDNRGMGGQSMPQELVHRVEGQLERFVSILKDEGVIVRRPTVHDLSLSISTPHFSVPCGFNFMNVRDLVLVVGNQIIETPGGAQSRYFETFSLRQIFKDYFRRGAHWVSAPKPELSRESYNNRQVRDRLGLDQELTSEYEPLFDAADFVRCGNLIVGQRGARTNQFGIEWLKRFLGEDFQVLLITSKCEYSVHIDTTFVPIGPERALINPNWIDQIPESVRGWELIEAPEPEGFAEPYRGLKYNTSQFIAMNVFMLDEERIFVDHQQKKLIRMLRDRGLYPIDIPFDLPPFLGGAFHCATLDIRRRSPN